MGTKKSLNLTELFYKKSETRTRAEITSEIDSTIRSHEVIAAKEEKANKVTSWSNPLSDVKYPSEKLVKNNLDTKASTTQLNSAKDELEGEIDTLAGTVTSEVSRIDTALNGKVDKVSGKGLSSTDFTQAEKTKLANIQVEANKIIVDTSLNPLSTNPVQNAVICANFMTYQGVVDLLNNIQTGHGKLLSVSIDSNGDLVVDDDGFEYYTSDEVDDGFTVNVEKQTNAESGYLSTYVVKQGGSQVGVKINIPKDFLVKSATLKTATSSDLSTLGSGFSVGDKYIDWVINSKDATGTAGAEHLYLNVKDLVVAYSADESTLTKNSSNVFSVKDGGISTAKLDSTLQTAISNISGKVDKVTGKGLSTNDFTASYKSQLDGLSTALAGKVNVNQGSSNSGKYLRVDTDGTVICATAPSSGGGSSSFSGDYLDLINTPDIPDKTSDLTNDGDGTNPFLTNADLSNYVQKSSTSGFLMNDGSVNTGSYSYSNHNHSGTYAPVSHTHSSSDVTDMESVELLVTFTDDTTLSLNLFKESSGGS